MINKEGKSRSWKKKDIGSQIQIFLQRKSESRISFQPTPQLWIVLVHNTLQMRFSRIKFFRLK